jgi:diadenosine tetraphosphate (Ap4A) HIT family hydrolase
MGCAIADSTMSPPGGIIAANPSCYLHQDPANPLEGFLVVGAKRHVRSLSDLTDGE